MHQHTNLVLVSFKEQMRKGLKAGELMSDVTSSEPRLNLPFEHELFRGKMYVAGSSALKWFSGNKDINDCDFDVWISNDVMPQMMTILEESEDIFRNGRPNLWDYDTRTLIYDWHRYKKDHDDCCFDKHPLGEEDSLEDPQQPKREITLMCYFGHFSDYYSMQETFRQMIGLDLTLLESDHEFLSILWECHTEKTKPMLPKAKFNQRNALKITIEAVPKITDIKNFDISVCAVGYDGNVLYVPWLQDLMDKKLRILKETTRDLKLERIVKYRRRSYCDDNIATLKYAKN
jgi:hypothetical protein